MPVTVDLYVNEAGWPHGLGMEAVQRSLIVKRWRESGMTVDDVGYIGEVDEMYSRDFLRAMQICDVRQFDDHGNCSDARVSSISLMFEGGRTAGCTGGGRTPTSPSASALDGIGNSTLRAKAERAWNGVGWLDDGYTKAGGFRKLPKNTTHFPLFSAHDFRCISGKRFRGWPEPSYTGYHMHNFFANATTMRNKYLTYGHPVKEAMGVSLWEIHEDLRTLIACGLNMTAVGGRKLKYALAKEGLDSLRGPVPLGFRVPGYMEACAAEMREMLRLDRDLGNITRR